jgi:mRNA interferase MazF
MNRKIRRGDMFYAALHSGTGSEQSGYRPILVLQNNTGNKHSQTVIVANITSRMFTKAKLPTHCPVEAQQGLGRASLILLEQLRTIDKSRLMEYIGTLGEDDMSRVDKALAVSVGLLSLYKASELFGKEGSI